MKEIITSQRLGEEYTKIKHSSGLDILLYPMEGFETAYALFATKYGSIDTTFKTQKDNDFITVPEGIAHFLEHKMFENEDGSDTFARYATTGASANAYTSFDHTAYLFSCTDNFKESLEILLDFVTNPYFTPETVEKEQGIIGQEINMYLDDADWRVMFNLFCGLYEKNPVRIDIAGTADSIAQIDDTLLYRCHNTFYNLNNMVLVLAGNFNPDEALSVADAILKPAKEISISRNIPEEPEAVFKEYTEQSLAVSQPMFELGFKHKPATEKEEYLNDVPGSILLDILIGEASPLYRRLYDEGLINSTLYTNTHIGRGFAITIFGGETRDPKKVTEEINKEIIRLKEEGIPADAFSRSKKATYGKMVGSFGNVTSVASALLSAHFVGAEGYDLVEAVAHVTLAQVEECLQKNLDPALSTLSVINVK